MNNKYTRGFTLAEVLIASMIFLLIGGAFSTALVMAIRQQAWAENYYRAVMIARNRIQQAWTLNFDDISMLAETETRVDEEGNPSSTGRYLRTTVVSNTSNYAKHIRVTVWYPKPAGGIASTPVEINTMISFAM